MNQLTNSWLRSKGAHLEDYLVFFQLFDEKFLLWIISLLADADGVECSDIDIADHLYNTFCPYVPHLVEDEKIHISPFTTDAGGGKGTKESCANEDCE